MKLGLLPLFRPESFTKDGFTASGLEYFSANALAEIAGFVEAQFPTIRVVTRLALNELLRDKPDIVLLWTTSACFWQVQPTAESLKTYLDVPVWLAGPHISYVPQSLPAEVDIAILGEVELPLQQLLAIFLKQPEAGPMQYRKVPGILYQSKGRIYSGTPAQVLPSLSQLPAPKFSMLLDLKGFAAPVLRSARVTDSLVTALAYPLSRKPRPLSPEQICTQVGQMAELFPVVFRDLPLTREQLMYLSMVFVPDYYFTLNRARLEALVPIYRERQLHRRLMLIPNLPAEAFSQETLLLLRALNTRKVLLQFGPFGHQNPLLPAWTPEALDRALTLCQRFQIGVLGTLYLNPDVGTSRRQLAQTYLFLRDRIERFESLQISPLGAYPGTVVWDQFVARTKPDSAALGRFPWGGLDLEKLSPDLPLHHSQLERYGLTEIFWAFKRMSSLQAGVAQPMTEDIFDSVKQQLVGEFLKRYIRPGERLLEVPLNPQSSIHSVLPNLPALPIHQLEVRAGRMTGTPPTEPVDLILLAGTLNGLRDPEAELRRLKAWLKPEGRVMVHWLNPLHIHNLIGLLRWGVRNNTGQSPILRHIKLEEMEDLLRRCGLEPIETDYTIMEGIEAVRPTVEALANRLEHHGDLRIPQHMLYVSEIKMLARNRS